MALRKPYIGQMDRKIKIYSFSKVQNSIGEEKIEKILLISPFASLNEGGGNENVSGKVMHLTNRNYIIRYNKNVIQSGVNYLINDNGIDYEITHIIEIGRKAYLQLNVFNYE